MAFLPPFFIDIFFAIFIFIADFLAIIFIFFVILATRALREKRTARFAARATLPLPRGRGHAPSVPLANTKASFLRLDASSASRASSRSKRARRAARPALPASTLARRDSRSA